MSSFDRQSDDQFIISSQPQSSTHLSVWEGRRAPVDRDGTVRTQVASSNEAARVNRYFNRPRLSFPQLTTDLRTGEQRDASGYRRPTVSLEYEYVLGPVPRSDEYAGETSHSSMRPDGKGLNLLATPLSSLTAQSSHNAYPHRDQMHYDSRRTPEDRGSVLYKKIRTYYLCQARNCGLRFQTADLLRNHRINSSDCSRSLTCMLCDEPFWTPEGLHSHLMGAHTDAHLEAEMRRSHGQSWNHSRNREPQIRSEYYQSSDEEPYY